MKADLNKWWLLPFGILIASALVALSIIIFEPTLTKSSFAEAAQQASSEPIERSDAADTASKPAEASEAVVSGPPKTSGTADVDCSGAKATDYVCYQQRYRDLVHNFGVRAAFDELRNEITKDDFVKANCHQMTHVIGRAAVDLYGDLPETYNHGDTFCGSGYYHGATEGIAAKIGPDKISDEANTLCADLGGHPKYSFYHYNCAHGLGHGFMAVYENELFKALRACDTLIDDWESERCYGGVFMENVIDENNPNHPSKYLKADQPLYPCTDVETRYKTECYQRQTSYALQTRGNDFSRVFGLCGAVEGDYQPACYQGLGWDASVQSLNRGISDVAIDESTGNLCMQGEGYEARSNCVVGAVEYFIRNYYSDVKAKTFCQYLSADLRPNCLQTADKYYKSFNPD